MNVWPPTSERDHDASYFTTPLQAVSVQHGGTNDFLPASVPLGAVLSTHLWEENSSGIFFRSSSMKSIWGSAKIDK